MDLTVRWYAENNRRKVSSPSHTSFHEISKRVASEEEAASSASAACWQDRELFKWDACMILHASLPAADTVVGASHPFRMATCFQFAATKPHLCPLRVGRIDPRNGSELNGLTDSRMWEEDFCGSDSSHIADWLADEVTSYGGENDGLMDWELSFWSGVFFLIWWMLGVVHNCELWVSATVYVRGVVRLDCDSELCVLVLHNKAKTTSFVSYQKNYLRFVRYSRLIVYNQLLLLLLLSKYDLAGVFYFFKCIQIWEHWLKQEFQEWALGNTPCYVVTVNVVRDEGDSGEVLISKTSGWLFDFPYEIFSLLDEKKN